MQAVELKERALSWVRLVSCVGSLLVVGHYQLQIQFHSIQTLVFTVSVVGFTRIHFILHYLSLLTPCRGTLMPSVEIDEAEMQEWRERWRR